MHGFVEFLRGHNNKLLRDMLVACSLVAVVALIAMNLVSQAVQNLRVATQPLPTRLEAQSPPSIGQTTTITRSVLDDPVTTGSIGNRQGPLSSSKDKK